MTHDLTPAATLGEPRAPGTQTRSTGEMALPCVLLVEHDDNLALALNRWLTQHGYVCTRLRDASQVHDTVVSAQPALVLLDAALPDNTGYQICQDIRTDPALSRLPIVLMTPRSTALEHRKAQALGATALLPKPFRLHELETALKQLAPAHP